MEYAEKCLTIIDKRKASIVQQYNSLAGLKVKHDLLRTQYISALHSKTNHTHNKLNKLKLAELQILFDELMKHPNINPNSDFNDVFNSNFENLILDLECTSLLEEEQHKVLLTQLDVQHSDNIKQLQMKNASKMLDANSKLKELIAQKHNTQSENANLYLQVNNLRRDCQSFAAKSKD